MKKSREIIRRDHRVISPSMTRFGSLVFERAKGCHIWDADGKKYLDFSSSSAVASVGHSNPSVEKSILRQLKKGSHGDFSCFYADVPVKFVESLLTFLPKSLNMAFLSNSGAESVEAAYKLAKWHTNKKWFIAFKPSFHGRTMGALSLMESKPVQKNRFGPFLPVKHVPYPCFYKMRMEPEECSAYCLEKLERTIKATKSLAGIILEPVVGESGYIVPPKSFIPGVRELCDKHAILLCDDEVQAGCYRTGKFLAIEHFKTVPDIVCLGKGIGGGVPIGVTVANKRLMDWPAGSHANTFGGNLLACAASIAVLRFMREKKLGENALKIGKILLKRLNEMKENHDIIGDVRGLGLMIGVELKSVKKRDAIIKSALEKGLVLMPVGESAIRIAPPLTITKEQAGKGLDIFEKSVREAS